MSKRTQLNMHEMVQAMRHLADVAALKNDPVQQRQTLVDGLNDMVGTDFAYFFTAAEWRPGRPSHFTHVTLGKTLDPALFGRLGSFFAEHTIHSDPFAGQMVGLTDDVNAATLRDLLPDRQTLFRYGKFHDFYRNTSKAEDGLVAFHRRTVDPTHIAGLAMHNMLGTGKLRPRQVALMHFVSGEIKSLVDRGHLNLDSPAEADQLPRRLQEILDHLLQGHAPKYIAWTLGISVWTVREHLSRLYKRFGVAGRDELMAKFIGGGQP